MLIFINIKVDFSLNNESTTATIWRSYKTYIEYFLKAFADSYFYKDSLVFFNVDILLPLQQESRTSNAFSVSCITMSNSSLNIVASIL